MTQCLDRLLCCYVITSADNIFAEEYFHLSCFSFRRRIVRNKAADKCKQQTLPPPAAAAAAAAPSQTTPSHHHQQQQQQTQSSSLPCVASSPPSLLSHPSGTGGGRGGSGYTGVSHHGSVTPVGYTIGSILGISAAHPQVPPPAPAAALHLAMESSTSVSPDSSGTDPVPTNNPCNQGKEEKLTIPGIPGKSPHYQHRPTIDNSHIDRQDFLCSAVDIFIYLFIYIELFVSHRNRRS